MRADKMAPAAAAVVAAATVLTACSSGPAPLRAAPQGSGVCFPGKPLGKYTYGVEDFTNHSAQTVVFDRVGLRDPVHLKVLGAYLAARDRSAQIGALLGWPPKGLDGLTDWARRRPVRGYRLRPGAATEVILGFQVTAPGGGISPGMLIWYHNGAGSYVLRDDLQIKVDVLGGNCR